MAYSINDGYPVTEGHCLAIPKRHVESYFDLNSVEVIACHELLNKMKIEIKSKDSSLSGNRMPEVDHFIPWARYPNDALTNFVVADKKCNNHKKDFLASEQHLNKWWKRISNTDDSSFKDLEHIAELRS